VPLLLLWPCATSAARGARGTGAAAPDVAALHAHLEPVRKPEQDQYGACEGGVERYLDGEPLESVFPNQDDFEAILHEAEAVAVAGVGLILLQRETSSRGRGRRRGTHRKERACRRWQL
jgi:hypothetical protein